MSYPDPFINDSPFWQPYAGPREADLAQVDHHASDLFDFLRGQSPVPKPERHLPPGVTLNRRDSGEWVLVYPAGGAGYRSVTGSYNDLIDIVEGMR